MKLYCEACRALVEAGRWSVIDGILRIGCATCGSEAELRPAAAPLRPAMAPPDAAPVPVVAPAAPAAISAPAAIGAPPAVAVDPAAAGDWLEAGWARLRASWADLASHQRLIAEAAVRGDFAGLGARYRDHLAAHPDDAVAAAAREQLIRQATAQLLARPAEGIGPSQARALRNGLLVLFLLGLIAFAVWMLSNLGGVG